MEQIEFANLPKEEKELLQAATEAGARYFNKKGTRHVGAALLGENGIIYSGTSVRRTNTSNSTCAERMALDRAILEGCFDYKLLAIVGFCDGEDSCEIISPCGLCRQILSEAEGYGKARKSIPIIISNNDFSMVVKSDSQKLFPLAYEAKVYTDKK